ncbi:cysteine desulfurase NifS [Acidithiobacillus sp. 'AMD consortium']|uniref:Cysteine desulfurase n=2 Tax=Acidithiobacillus ferridurans TaxID=1232575 RepID=A0A8X8G6X7_ACIFI|nr:MULTISPECIES: cysteine desulfurase NifS [Acidithiobacillus]MBU2715525.1 cysteine desulfurase NifS [Acidithiobacillus ferridurans]MBU2722729.1 cysteine desulfurase NifS [Acidithiobacillus ferridurans]MBU2726377.1 cysteine desulfurase NifS [Acidithiobacillus ferridurans]QFG78287.1 cysteine desulfurase NifS [Acidithiobacillus sp. 'AMD consortium']BBF66109.1 Cysteine desulfurase NifS [Acidithiobacillus ferridurans]
MSSAYMDNNATTRVDPRVLETILPYFSEYYGNPSSMHSFGGDVGKRLEEARASVRALLGAEHDSEIIFTSCGTESDNTAILSALAIQPSRREIITSVVEHPAILSLCDHLERHEGYKVHYIPVDRLGRISMEAYAAALSEQVAVVSIMYANNETGTIFPVESMARMAKEKGVLFHTDAVQAVGKIALNMQESAIDMLSLSGHKLHAPKGVGALYVRRGTRYRPMLRGGHQERGRRAGTENTTGIIALGLAADMALEHMEYENTVVRALRDRLEAGILAQVPYAFANGDPEHRLPNTSSISFEYIEGEAILMLLSRVGIAASSGSACTSGSLEPSHVLRAMDIPYTAAHGTIRFSLSRETTETEVDWVIAQTPPIVEQLRRLSPYWGTNGPILTDNAFAPVYA